MNRIVKTFVVGIALAFSMSATAQVRETERLVSRAEASVDQINRARAQLVDTLEVYNSLMSGAGDSKKLYSDLQKAADRSEDRRDDVRKKSEEMEEEAHKFFEDWTKSLGQISDEDMKRRSQERLDETRLSFGNILTVGRRAGADFDVFMGGLRDQIAYLGFDLNPAGIASLAEDADRLNAMATAMFEAIDGVTATITDYANNMKAQ